MHDVEKECRRQFPFLASEKCLSEDVRKFSSNNVGLVGNSTRMPFQPLFFALVEALERANFESIKQLTSKRKLCAWWEQFGHFLFNIVCVFFFSVLFSVFAIWLYITMCCVHFYIRAKSFGRLETMAMWACDRSTTSDNKSCEFLMCLTLLNVSNMCWRSPRRWCSVSSSYFVHWCAE